MFSRKLTTYPPRCAEQMIWAVVPAKKNSSRCPNKNWIPFANGESLTEKKFLFAVGTAYFHHTVLSIDFPQQQVDFLKKPGNRYALTHSHGWTVRRRPIFMFDDSVTVLLDALEYVGAQDQDIYCLLQPTSPFLSTNSLHKALRHVQETKEPVVSVNPMFKPSGGIYANTVGNLRHWPHSIYYPKVHPLPLDWRESLDVDYYYDFEIARSMQE